MSSGSNSGSQPSLVFANRSQSHVPTTEQKFQPKLKKELSAPESS
jgi:hypothetical protein